MASAYSWSMAARSTPLVDAAERCPRRQSSCLAACSCDQHTRREPERARWRDGDEENEYGAALR
eukprot:791458-Rhodomonas_salina.1